MRLPVESLPGRPKLGRSLDGAISRVDIWREYSNMSSAM
jgi:hypothetical protein